MRPLWKDVLVAVWLGMILPGIVLNAFVLKERHKSLIQVQALQTDPVQPTGPSILVRNADGHCEIMELENYLKGVVLAEMPGSFHDEALKAQSVAARTYTWKAHTTGGKHGDGSICVDAFCCQAYLSEEDYLSLGGTQDHLDKVCNAVESTAGFVLSYEGELIEATYFSSSGGRTEAAVAVWGADYPYLQAVSSPEKVTVVTDFYDKEAFQKLLGFSSAEAPVEWFGDITYTEGGGINTIEICGEIYSGVRLRSLLGLRSTDFQIQPEEETIRITTRGYGHRVGMSQYGANTMAETGSTWQQILQHYYPCTNVVLMY